MRIWSIHPRFLDAKGLVALWRETLLAQHVLNGTTKGYRNHPQLERFKALENPVGGIDTYLEAVLEESIRRGYSFNASKVGPHRVMEKMTVTQGQMAYEQQHLLTKLAQRDHALHDQYASLATLEPHPLFKVIPGGVESWEVTGDKQ